MRKKREKPEVDYKEVKAISKAEKYLNLKWRDVFEGVAKLMEENEELNAMQALRELGYSDEIIDYPTSPLGLYIYRKTGKPLIDGFVGDAAKLLNISWDEARRLMEWNSDVLNGIQENDLEKSTSGLRSLESALGSEL